MAWELLAGGTGGVRRASARQLPSESACLLRAVSESILNVVQVLQLLGFLELYV